MILIKTTNLDSIVQACKRHGAKAYVRKLSFYGFEGFAHAEMLGLTINDKVVQSSNLRSETLASMDFIEQFIKV